MKPLDSTKLNQILSDWLDGHIDAADTAGGEILVTQHGERLCHIVKGVADIRTGRPLEPNALYRLASMTKPITGLAALIAVQKGWFSLEDEVRKHLPEFGGLDVAVLRDGRIVRDHRARSELKIWQMLCHVSGILAGADVGARLEKAAPPSAYQSIGAMVSYAASQPLAFDPSGAYGTHFWIDPENQITAILMRNMRWHDTHGAGEMGVEFERLVMQCA